MSKSGLESHYKIFKQESKVTLLDDKIIDYNSDLVNQLCDLFYNDKILSIIVEGGTKTLNNFIENGIWDEMRIFKSKTNLGQGVNGPEINLIPEKTKNIDDDILEFYINKDFTFSNI